MKPFRKTLDQLKIVWNSFTNCGVRHIQDTKTKEVVLGQVEYVKKIKTITHPSMRTSATNAEAGHELHQLYMSLLGAIAYTTMTRPDAIVCVCALQRFNHEPTIINDKSLNALTRWLQHHPRGLRYRRLSAQSGRGEMQYHLRMSSDAAFKKEEEKGHSMRGACYIKSFGQDQASVTKACQGHFLDFASRSQRHVTRSTFPAELFATCDTADHGMRLSLMLHEIAYGPVSKAVVRNMREQ